MSRQSTDPALLSLANALGEVKLLTNLETEESARCQALFRGSKTLKHITALPNGRDFSVTLFIGGMRRHIAWYHSPADYETMIRVSDMAALYFWPYRLYGGDRAPVPSEFTLGLARAKADLEVESGVTKMFWAIETHLLTNGMPTREEVAASRTKRASPRVKNSIRKSIPGILASLESQRELAKAILGVLDTAGSVAYDRNRDMTNTVAAASKGLHGRLNDIEQLLNGMISERQTLINLLTAIVTRLNK